MAEYKFDLSTKINNKVIKLKNGSTDTVKFENDVAGQVVRSESGNNIVFTVYRTEKRGYQYTRVIEKFEDIESTTKSKMTTTKYVYTNGVW